MTDALASPTHAQIAAAARRERRRWLAGLGRSGGRDEQIAGVFTALDGLAAVGVAGGLALTVNRLVHGLPALGLGLILLLLSGLVRGGLAFGALQAGGRASHAVKRTLRDQIVRATLLQAPGAKRPVGEALSLVVEAVERLDGYFACFAPAQVAAGLGPLIGLAAMALASPVCAAITLASFAPMIGALVLAGSVAAEAEARQLTALTRLSGVFADRLRALPIIVAFQAQGAVTAGLAQAAQDLSQRTLRVLRLAFLSSAALEFFAALSVALIAVYCGFNLLHLLPFPAPETLTLARAIFVLALAPEVYFPMRRLAAAYHDRQQADAAAEAMIPVLAEVKARPMMRSLTAAPSVQFAGVEVLYPDQVHPAVSAFSLTVKPGEVVALMGPTGCGKSTLLHLLLGLAPLSAGQISIDEAGLTPGETVQAGWAGQAPIVIPGTLLDNVWLARRDATRDEVVHAAHLVGLSGGESCGLSRWIDERGGGLSGGERRRLGLARALLCDPPLLLLDEPTAHLDAAAEAALLPILAKAMQGRTTLIATHSSDVARLADRVIRLGSRISAP